MAAGESFEVPILLLSFNRPDSTRQVLNTLRDLRPSRLFLASDGPRSGSPTDAVGVSETRALFDEVIDWPCIVDRRFSTVNQGCRVTVSSAISWFFENVEEGIILEDDCVPHPEFFSYCSELLDRYRQDDRIMCISGDNSAKLVLSDSATSYCFCRQSLIWGWATWRRAWNHYDDELRGWQSIRDDEERQRVLWPDAAERRWQAQTLDSLLLRNEPDSWAYRWAFSVASRDGLSVIPAVNLVQNVGFDSLATHTTFKRHSRARVPGQPILPLSHPAKVERDEAVESQIFLRIHGGRYLRGPFGRARGAARRLAGRLFRSVWGQAGTAPWAGSI